MKKNTVSWINTNVKVKTVEQLRTGIARIGVDNSVFKEFISFTANICESFIFECCAKFI
jgi:hypothetical protein